MATKNTNYEIVTPADLGFDSEVAINVHAASQYVRALHLNWRQGTVGCKTRSEVAFSNFKPWKQKGTGRARAGSRRSPLWRKGGIIFGPQPRVRMLKITKNLRANVLGSIIYGFLAKDRVYSLNFALETNKPKTSFAFKALRDAGLVDKKVNLFVSSTDVMTQASFANIPHVQMLYFDECNAYNLAVADYVVCLKKDVGLFKEMVSKWI